MIRNCREDIYKKYYVEVNDGYIVKIKKNLCEEGCTIFNIMSMIF